MEDRKNGGMEMKDQKIGGRGKWGWRYAAKGHVKPHTPNQDIFGTFPEEIAILSYRLGFLKLQFPRVLLTI